MTGLPWLDNLSDRLYQHSTEFHVVLIVATVVVVAGLALVFRRSLLKLGLVVVAAAVTAVALVLLADAVAARSNARDIARRVRQVAATLPPIATRTAVQVGGNFQIETYQVPGDLATVSQRIARAMHAAFDRPGATGMDYPVGGASTFLTVSFLGRNGCDGSVDVSVNSKPANATTTIEISGHCED